MVTALPTIIRCSALTGYPDCNRRGAARLFWREISAMGFRLRSTPRGIGAAIGSAVHKAAEVILREKAETGRLPPSTVAADCAAETLAESVREGVDFDRTTANRVEGEVTAVGMARAYHRVVAPTVNAILIEERLEAEVAPGLILSGTPDLVAREPHRIRDLKTSSRPGGSHAPQIGGYSLLARSHGLDIAEAAVEQHQAGFDRQAAARPGVKAGGGRPGRDGGKQHPASYRGRPRDVPQWRSSAAHPPWRPLGVPGEPRVNPLQPEILRGLWHRVLPRGRPGESEHQMISRGSTVAFPAVFADQRHGSRRRQSLPDDDARRHQRFASARS